MATTLNMYRIASPPWRARLERALAGVCLAAMLITGSAAATSLEFIVDSSDGETFIKNPSASAEVLDGYTITSPGDALLVGGWTPIAGNYDLGADQSVDSVADWFVISSSVSSVTEVSLVAESGLINPGQIVSLGNLYNTSLLPGFIVMTAAGTETTDLVADFRTLTADYDDDLDVDIDDYAVFATTFGSAIDLRADGNNDGVVDAADYTVWRDSGELSLTPTEVSLAIAHFSGPVSGGATAIPEPAAALLVIAALGLAANGRRRRG